MKKNQKCRIKLLLSSLFLFVPFLLNAANGQDETMVSLNFTNAPLSQVLNEVGRQTSLRIVYNTKDVNPDKIISVKVNQEKLSSVMTNLLRNTNSDYAIKDNYLVLYSAKNNDVVKATSQQSKRTIKGVVSDEFGEPLIGVSVLVRGTTVGAITDIDCYYFFYLENNFVVLEFIYIGY